MGWIVWILLVVGFVLLVKGADIFVSGASAIAKRMNVSPLIIGLTIVAFGTSAPEASVSITAAVNNANQLAVGNILGSNLFNLLFILGMCSVMRPSIVKKDLFKRDIPLSLIAAVCVFIFTWDSVLGDGDRLMVTRAEGIVLLIFFCIFMVSMFSASKSDVSEQIDLSSVMSTKKAVLFTVIGLAAIVGGGQLTVYSCTDIARTFGMSENLIGLTIAAVGTSLPELVTSIVASRKGENDIALGNVIGSNIFNILFILGISSVITPIPVSIESVFDAGILIVASLLVLLFAKTSKKIGRIESASMVILYAGYLAYIIIR